VRFDLLDGRYKLKRADENWSLKRWNRGISSTLLASLCWV